MLSNHLAAATRSLEVLQSLRGRQSRDILLLVIAVTGNPVKERMNKTMQAKTASVREMVSTEEWQARVDLAAAYRLVAHYGWDDLVFTHISSRVAGSDHHFLINPYGMMFDEITASSLVKIDLQGNKVMDSPYSINPAGFTIHSAVHGAREDAMCVMHLHTEYGIAISAK
jgi:hypothetical protein